MAELLLKASFIIGIALLFYKSVLQQESFFALNRAYLICAVLLAFALPYLSLPKLVENQGYLGTVIQAPLQSESLQTAGETLPQQRATNAAEALQDGQPQQNSGAATALPQPTATAEDPALEAANSAQSTNTLKGADTFQGTNTHWSFWLAGLYLFGVAIFTLNLLFQLGSLFLKIAKAPDKIRDGQAILVTLTSPQAPCSFFNYIFIYPDAYGFETYEQILAHEKIHVRKKHSLDLLLAELAVIILWFNPLMWLYKKELEKNLEFQTDALLLAEESVGKQQYQLSLLQIATPHKPLTITTNYNQSLLKQRIMMMNAKKSTLHGYWKYAFLAPLLLGTLLLLNEPAISQNTSATPLPQPQAAAVEEAPREPEPEARLSINIRGDRNDMSKGYWYSQQKGTQYCLQLKGDLEENRNWSMSDCFDKSLFVKKGENLFQATKESGTLTLTGKLDQEVGQGTYEFKKDLAFEKYLTDNNIRNSDQNLMFFLFLNDVGKEYITFLKRNYKELNGERLLEVAIHDISQQDIQDYIDLFQQYNKKKPSMQEVVEANIHGIDKEYVQELQSLGFTNIGLDKMMEAKIHDVDATYIAELKKAGYENLPLEKIIEAKIHDMDASSISEIRALGFKLDLDKMMEVKIHDVDAQYIQDLNAAGFTNLDIDQILEAKIHDISPEAIKEIQSLGFKDLSLDKIVEVNIHNLDAAFIKDLAAAGFTNLSIDKLLEAKIHEVSGGYIQKARKNGYEFNDLDKYIQLKIHGLSRTGDDWE